MNSLKAILVLFVALFITVACAGASTVTLSQAALMNLDYAPFSNLTAEVVGKRISGDGVEFDISFKGNAGQDSQIFYSSSIFGGSGSLVFGDISQYDYFGLDVELLAVDSAAGSGIENFELWFSPMVDDGDTRKPFAPVFLSSAQGQNSAQALMNVSFLATGLAQKGDLVFEFGFEAHMDNPDNWPSDGALVTLLVSPTQGAQQIVPEPTTALLLLSCGLLLRRKS